ncbi:MAG: DUF106 domain-containing protein [Candidatus Methanospirareceae archaeon]
MQRGRNREVLKRGIETFFVSFGFFLLFGIAIIPELREGLGRGLDIVLSPLVTTIGKENILLIIFLLAILTGIYTSLIQKYTMNWEIMEKAREFQKRLRELQKEYIEAKRENNKHRMKKIEKKRLEMIRKQSEISSEVLRQQLKPMAYISIITIPLFMWMYWYIGRNPMEVLFPIIGRKSLTDSWFIFPYWVIWYIICSIPIAQLIRKLLGVR